MADVESDGEPLFLPDRPGETRSRELYKMRDVAAFCLGTADDRAASSRRALGVVAGYILLSSVAKLCPILLGAVQVGSLAAMRSALRDGSGDFGRLPFGLPAKYGFLLAFVDVVAVLTVGTLFAVAKMPQDALEEGRLKAGEDESDWNDTVWSGRQLGSVIVRVWVFIAAYGVGVALGFFKVWVDTFA